MQSWSVLALTLSGVHAVDNLATAGGVLAPLTKSLSAQVANTGHSMNAPPVGKPLSKEMLAGLMPHHDSGADKDDPLLFRHRWQHHDAEANKLWYYQYEAKRHPHVSVLSETDVTSCSS